MTRSTSIRAAVLGATSLLLAAQSGAGQEFTLAQALDSALASHPALGAAWARVEGANAARESARATWLPSITASGGITHFQNPMLVAPLHSFDPSSIPAFEQSLIRGELGARYTVFEGGARRARVRGADAMAGAARMSLEATEAELLERVTEGYLLVLSAREILAAANRQVRALESERDRAGRQLAEGTAPRVEVLRAEAAVLDARVQATSAEAGVGLAQRALARLIGVDLHAFEGRALQEIDIGTQTAWGAAAHPVLERSRRAMDGALAKLDQERASRLPRISASAALMDYGSLGADHVAEWQAGLQISWPIFTGGARSASIDRAEADLRAAQDELRLTQLQIDSEADAAEAALAESTARADALEAAVVQWEEVARIEGLSVQEGAGVQSDLLRAEAGLFQARAGFARARHESVLASVRLARARGKLNMTWMATALEMAR